MSKLAIGVLGFAAMALIGVGCGGGVSAVRVAAQTPLGSATELQPPAGSPPASLIYPESVSCASADDCASVGHYFSNGGGEGALLFAESGGHWSSSTPALPGDAAASGDVSLDSVACPAPNACTAVGKYTVSAGDAHGLIVQQAGGGGWATGIEPALPADAGSHADAVLSSIACPVPGDCTAIGTYSDSAGNQQSLLISERDGTWGPAVSAPLPADAVPESDSADLSGSNLRAISCGSAGNCAVVGTYYDTSGSLEGLLLVESGGTWTAQRAPLPSDAQPGGDPTYFELSSVSCPSTNDCTAVGHYPDALQNDHGLILTDTNGSWTALTSPSPDNAADEPKFSISSVACASAGNCTAVGTYTDTVGGEDPLILTESSGTWTAVGQVAPPGNANTNAYAALTSVACASARSCSAVGFYTDSANAQRGLQVQKGNGKWLPEVEAPLPANAHRNADVALTSVACSGAGACTSVGAYVNSSGVPEGLAVSGPGS